MEKENIIGFKPKHQASIVTTDGQHHKEPFARYILAHLKHIYPGGREG
jgi:PIN domain nuclease of toxin-antitoxin system